MLYCPFYCLLKVNVKLQNLAAGFALPRHCTDQMWYEHVAQANKVTNQHI